MSMVPMQRQLWTGTTGYWVISTVQYSTAIRRVRTWLASRLLLTPPPPPKCKQTLRTVNFSTVTLLYGVHQSSYHVGG